MGKYVPFARLDSGGMADVFVAVAQGPSGFNKLAVIKRLRNGNDGDQVRMFLDEARLSARLSHPNIVNTYEVGESNGSHFMALEYLEGQPLAALLTKLGTRSEGLSESLIAFIAAQALKALHYAHELRDYDGTHLGVVHRDVSPQNLFLTYGGEVKLLDFGIAKATVNLTRTDTGVLKGKIRYMAPEQVGEKDVDRRVDVFALGIVLWEMLTRQRLFDGDSYSVITKIASGDAPNAQSVRPEVSPELAAIAARALHRNKADRYQTAAAMQADLEALYRSRQSEAPDTELARIMALEFAENRDKVRTRIQAFLAGLDSKEARPTALDSSTDLLPALLSDGSGPKPSPSAQSSASLRPSHTSAKTTILGLKGRSSASKRVRATATAVVAVAALAIGFRLWGPHAGATAVRETSPPVAPTLARVHLESNPSGAEVERNGIPLGRTPTDLTLEPGGAQALVFLKDGFEPETIVLDVKANETIDRAVLLRAIPAAADAAPSTPLGASPTSPPGAVPRARPAAMNPPRATPKPKSNATVPDAPPRPNIRVLDDGQ